jgi:4-hydroxythreonine-4-phosphate dehydrogenase
MVPTIAISGGDPAGIGPEVVLKALNDDSISAAARWLVVCDRIPLAEAERITQLRLPSAVEIISPGCIQDEHDLRLGETAALHGSAAVSYIRTATQLCLDGKAHAMVTGPVSKEAVAATGQPFSGHTEYIAELCGVRESRMLLVGPRLRVVHVSTHVPLREACKLDTDRIHRTIVLGHSAMQLLGYDRPRVAVCGLNPHAGEHGLFGTEDETAIEPAVRRVRSEGMHCEGPVPADTVFFRAARGEYDLVVAMYHDQGHIPVKLLDFDKTVNVSLGLPIIRTSVDHGTAFDIAGRNRADPESMKAAMRLAVGMASRHA